jgi:hypothetical protein
MGWERRLTCRPFEGGVIVTCQVVGDGGEVIEQVKTVLTPAECEQASADLLRCSAAARAHRTPGQDAAARRRNRRRRKVGQQNLFAEV